MNWININTSQSRDPRYMDSTWLERGAWLSMLGYCTERETDGVIVGARLWTNRQWLIALGGSLTDISRESGLWKWIGDDLHLELYPHQMQSMVVARREAGRRGGKAKTDAKIAASRTNKPRKADENIQAKSKQNPSKIQANIQPKGKGKGKDKGKDKDSLFFAREDEEWKKVWFAFPRKIDEAGARKIYIKSKVEPQVIIESLAAWAASDEWTREDGRFIPHPTKWLEREDWKGRPTTTTPKQFKTIKCTL